MTELPQEDLETTTETLEQESRDSAAAYERLWKRLDEQDARIEKLTLKLLDLTCEIADTDDNLLHVKGMVLAIQPAQPTQANCPKCGALYRGAEAPGMRSCPVGCGAPRF